jgi:cysteine-rich repeat protein
LSGRTYVQDFVVCPESTCGNGMQEHAEQCDDGNTVAGDGCSASCQDEAS